jgi:very-short-patch-repair endonuclease
VAHVEREATVPSDQQQSLGVIAFSETQMLAILSELESRKPSCPDLECLLDDDGEGGLFVKNLESVQGDERDVILFSIGYGRDGSGRLTMSFGPLNASGGERRLNVAVTRARQRVTVVTSILAHEIDGSPERPAGVRALRAYLEYAEHGPRVLSDGPGRTSYSQAVAEGASPFEEAVRLALAAQLAGQALQVVARVGVGEQPVDLAIRDRDGRYLLAIESDGETFAGLPTARDRDRLRHEILERLGWQVHRIWSPTWVTAQQEEQQRVLAAIERARRIRDGVMVDETPLAVLKLEDRPAQGPGRPNARVPGTMSTPSMTSPPGPLSGAERGPGGEVSPARPIDKVPEAEIAAAVRAVLLRAFAMPQDDLVVAVARELGYQRTGGRIKVAVRRATERMIGSGAAVEAGGHVRLSAPDA